MLPQTPLLVPDVVGFFSAALDLVAVDLTGDLTAQLSAIAKSSDSVSLYGSNLPTISPPDATNTQVTGIGAIGGITGNNTTITGGQMPVTVRSPLYRYLYALRTGGTTHGLHLVCVGSEPNGGGGGGSVSSVASADPNIAVAPTTGAVLVSAPGLGKPTIDNKGMTGNTTTADAQAATLATVAVTPKGYVQVFVNGVAVDAGSAVLGTTCFFGPSNSVASPQGAINAGDTLWWNGSVAGYQIAPTDVIDFAYDA